MKICRKMLAKTALWSSLAVVLCPSGECDAFGTARRILLDDAVIDTNYNAYTLVEDGIKFKYIPDGSSGNTEYPVLVTESGSNKVIQYKANPIAGGDKQRSEHWLWTGTVNQEYWTGFKIKRCPETTPQTSWNLIHQWLQDNPSMGPAVGLGLDKTGATTNLVVSTYGNNQNNVLEYKEYNELGEFPSDAWTELIFHVKVSPTGGAILQVYKNGSLMIDRSGDDFCLGLPIGGVYGGKYGICQKLGVYRGIQNTTLAVQYDDVRVGDSYAAVAPASADLEWIGNDWVGYWDFDRPDGFAEEYDFSLHGHQADLFGFSAYGFKYPGVVGNAIKFDGVNDHINAYNLGDSLEYSGGSYAFPTFTIAFWINIDTGETDGGYILTKHFNDQDEYNYSVYLAADRRVCLKMRPNSANVWEATLTNSLSTGTWHFIVILQTAGTNQIRCWVDGGFNVNTNHSISSWTPDYGDDNLPLCIGSYYPHTGVWSGISAESFKGKLDEVRIWPRQLPSTEHMALYAAENALIAMRTGCWSFNESSGSSAANSAGTAGAGALYEMNTSTCWQNGSLAFDGIDDRVNIGDTTDLRYSGGSFTVLARVRWEMDANSGVNDEGYILSKPWDGSGHYNYFIHVQSNGTLHFRMDGKDAQGYWKTWQKYANESGMPKLNFGEWATVAMTVNSGGIVTAYLNGNQIFSLPHEIFSWPTTSGKDLCIGYVYPYVNDQNDKTKAFKGNIDEVQVYKRVLPADEIYKLSQ